MTGKKSPSRRCKGKPPSASGVHGDDPALRQACIDLAGGVEPILFIVGHDDAVIGVADRDGDDVVVYDIEKIIRRLRQRDGMSKEDAEELSSYNIAGMRVGDHSPILVKLHETI
jgi:hypothetical protein